MYYSTFITDESNGKKVNWFSSRENHTPFQYLAAIHDWEKQDRAYKRKVLNNIKKKDFDGLSLEDVWSYSLVLWVSLWNIDITTIPKVLIEKFLAWAHLNVLCPNYLLTLPEVAQALFFLFYFKALRNDDKLNDPDSDIWKYLLQRFKNIEVVTERYRWLVDRRKKIEKTQNDTSKQVDETVKSTIIKKLIVGEDIPTMREIEFVNSLYWKKNKLWQKVIYSFIDILLKERMKYGWKKKHYQIKFYIFFSWMPVESWVNVNAISGEVTLLDIVLQWS